MLRGFRPSQKFMSASALLLASADDDLRCRIRAVERLQSGRIPGKDSGFPLLERRRKRLGSAACPQP